MGDFIYALEFLNADVNQVEDSKLTIFQRILKTPSSSEFIKNSISNGGECYKVRLSLLLMILVDLEWKEQMIDLRKIYVSKFLFLSLQLDTQIHKLIQFQFWILENCGKSISFTLCSRFFVPWESESFSQGLWQIENQRSVQQWECSSHANRCFIEW